MAKQFKSAAHAFLSERADRTHETQGTQRTHEPAPTKKHYRVNLKLKPEYEKYLAEVSWENRVSITQYINELIGADMKKRRT